MRVALAHDHLFQVGGAESVLKELTRLFPAAPIYTLIHDRRRSAIFNQSHIITPYWQHLPGAVRFFKFFLPFMPRAWEKFDFSKYDLVLSSSSAFVKGLLTTGQTKHLCYCHSPTRGQK